MASGEYVSADSYVMQSERQKEMASFLLECGFDWHAAINTNEPHITEERGLSALRMLDARLCRYYLGKKWSQCPDSRRPFVVSITEQAGGELHYHVLLKDPLNIGDDWRKYDEKCFGLRLTNMIKRPGIFPAGDVTATRLCGPGIDSMCEIDNICYVAKKLSGFGATEAVTFWSVFRNQRSAVYY